MSAGAIKAGEAFVKIWANDAEARKALNSLQARVKRFADEVSSMGARVGAVGLAIAAPFAASAKRFAGFADTMSTVKGVTGAVGAEFDALNATAKRLGETTSFTALEASEGMLALARAGFTATENMASLPTALNLARAGALGLGDATTIMADTMRSFGIAAESSERVADVLAKASNIANTDVTLLGESMKNVAANANMTRQSLENVTAALAVMANNGIKGARAGSSLQRMMLSLVDAKKQAQLKTDFGIDVVDAKGEMRDILAIMRELGEATKNMGGAEKASTFQDIFGAFGFQAATILSKNADQWDEFAQRVRESAGTASAMAAEMDNNIGGSFRLMMSAVEGVQIAIGEATEGTLRDWMKSIEGAAQSISAFVTANKDFVVGVMKLGATLLGAGAALFAFGKGAAVIGGVIGMVAKYGGGLKALQDRLNGVTAAEQAKVAADKALDAAGAAHAASLKKQEGAQKAQEAAFARSEAAAYKAATARQKLDQAERDSSAAAAEASQKRIAVADAEAKAMLAIRQATIQRDSANNLARRAQGPNWAEEKERFSSADPVAQFAKNADKAEAAAARARAELVKRTNELTAAETRAAGTSQAVATAQRGVEKADMAAAATAGNLGKANDRLAQSQERTASSAGRLNSALYGATEAEERLRTAMERANAPAQHFARGLTLLSQSATSIRQAASLAADAIGSVFSRAIGAAGRAAAQAGASISQALAPALERISRGVSGAAGALSRILGPAASAAGEAVSRAAGRIRNAFQQAADATRQAVGHMADALGRALAPAANIAGEAIQRVGALMNRAIGPAAGMVSQAMQRVGQSFRQAAQSAMAFGQAAVGAMGSPKVAAAAGSVAMLAGSLSMLGGDSSFGKIMQWVAQIAGIAMAASGAVVGVQALRTAMQGMSAGALAATTAFLKLAAAIAVAFAAYKAGEWINHKISGFDGEQITKDAKQFSRNAVDSSGDDLLKAQQKILARIGALRGQEAEQGVDLGAFRLVNPFGDNKALNAEINALEAELEGIEEQYRAQKKSADAAKKASDEAAETERIEANRQAVKDLAEAWENVLKKLEDVNKQRADRARDKQFSADVEADPNAAKSQASSRFDEAKAAEDALVKRLHELEAKRQELLAGGGTDTETLGNLQTEIESALKEYEAAVAETDVWERFFEKADDAVTRTRESLQKLVEEAKKLDLDQAKKQDDARFKDLLATDWRSASEEVAQAMARVNSDWIATGQRVAELQAKAEGGDIGAQRELEKALEQRKELATERGHLEGRQKEVDSTKKTGEQKYDNVRRVLNDEAKHKAKEDWTKEAKKDPRAANAALDAFITDLEAQLANTGTLAEQARVAQDYAGASAYEEQAKALKDQLSELRGMKGQTEERDTVTGEFSARAMEAMMRGGGGNPIEKQQLETQQSMNERLGKLVDLYAAPTVIAVD